MSTERYAVEPAEITTRYEPWPERGKGWQKAFPVVVWWAVLDQGREIERFETEDTANSHAWRLNYPDGHPDDMDDYERGYRDGAAAARTEHLS